MRSAHFLGKNLKKCFLDTTWRVMLSNGSNIQPHIVVLPVAKRLNVYFYDFDKKIYFVIIRYFFGGGKASKMLTLV